MNSSGNIVIYFGDIKQLRFGALRKNDVHAAKIIIKGGMKGFSKDGNSQIWDSSIKIQDDVEDDLSKGKPMKNNILSDEELNLISDYLEMDHDKRKVFVYDHKELLFSIEGKEYLEYLANHIKVIPASRVRVLRELLLHCQSIGIESSFSDYEDKMNDIAEKIMKLVSLEQLKAKREFLHQNTDLISDLGLHVTNELINGAILEEDKDSEMVLGQHIILFVKCRQFGVDESIDEIIQGKDDYWDV